ncbi:MAG: DUF2200 domain-containing protein [Clostridia bacterium]|nr:DUF2200 domain-containing protein [Clostridia bacterium]
MPGQNIFDMAFTKVYPLLIAKAGKKGRTREEVFLVTSWLTGYSDDEIAAALESGISYGAFFSNAPAWSPRADLITGKVCGVQVEAVADPLMKRVRQLDKLVDELAKGRPMEKVIR